MAAMHLNISSRIYLGSEFVWPKNNWVRICLGKKNLGQKFGLAKFYFGLIRFVCDLLLDYCKVKQQQHRVSVVGGGGWVDQNP